jgi:TRAP-type C4-dicarboxylate transport system permease small subunit
MVILVFINAVMRYAFHSSIPVSEEYARFFFMWTVFFGVIAAFRDKAHVSVTIVTDYLKGKAKIYVYLIAQAITIIILGLLLIGGITYTISASTYNTVATGINFGIVVSGFVIMIVGSLGIIINDTITKIKEIKEGE